MRILLLISIISYFCSNDPAIAQSINQQTLEAFRWQHRLLVFPIKSTDELQQWQRIIQHHTEDIDARKLLFLLLEQNKTYVLSTAHNHIAEDPLHKELQILAQRHPNKVILLGLDGDIKKYYPSNHFNLEQAFAEIDLMPMRRWEIE